jgi:anti-sigma regulatory factor (Ser/Thr protein kinase)/uncharacterized protein YigA (DUF484 family)
VEGDVDDGEIGTPATGTLDLGAAEGAAGTSIARHWVRRQCEELGLGGLVEDIELVVSELVTNAVIHAGTAIQVRLRPAGDGARVEVRDGRPELVPVSSGTGLLDLLELDDVDDLLSGLTDLDVETMTGRGMTLVEAVCDRWGVEALAEAKVVWAEIATGRTEVAPQVAPAAPPSPEPGGVGLTVTGVPVRLVLAGAAQLDDLVRELQVTSLPSSLPADVVDIAARFVAITAQIRDPFRQAAREAVERRERLLDVTFVTPPQGGEALEGFLDVLEQITALSLRGELLSMAPPDEVMEFRRWAVDEIVRQLAGERPRPCPFPVVPPDDPAVVTAARRAADRLSGMGAPVASDDGWFVAVQAALVGATDVDDVVRALIDAGDGLGAATGSLCILSADGHTVELTATANYEDAVVDRWTTFPVTADLPVSEVIRTGEPMFLRTSDELLARYPVFADTPRVDGESLAVLPLDGPASPCGALVLGFDGPRRFDQDEATILGSLAGLVAEALRRI